MEEMLMARDGGMGCGASMSSPDTSHLPAPLFTNLETLRIPYFWGVYGGM